MRRAGWVTCSIVFTILTLLSYFCCILVYESTRLLIGNYKMKQKVDFESLLSSQMTQKSLAVSFTRQLYLLQLICVSSIGIIMSTYTADNLFEILYGKTFGLQLAPEAKIIFEKNSGTQPFQNNYFCISIGLLIVFFISLVIFAFDFEKEKWFQPVKLMVILSFIGVSCSHFVDLQGGIDNLNLSEVPQCSLNFGFVLGILSFSYSQSAQVPNIIADSNPDQYFKLPVFLALVFGLIFRIAFGLLGAIAYTDESNLFDDLFFSANTPPYMIILVFVYAVIVVLPVVIRSSLMAKYLIYIGGICEVPSNYFCGIILPWILGVVINHMQIYAYLINWTALITHLYVQFVCPMFMWSKSVKEAQVYELNFKQSLQMMVEGDKPSKSRYDTIQNSEEKLIDDGVPSIDHSVTQKTDRRQNSTSKFLLNDPDDDERLSNITDIVFDEDEEKFIHLYNVQGHYSAYQSCCTVRCARKFVKMNAYFISAALFIFMYLSLVDVFGEKMKSYGNSTAQPKQQ
ncbi:UNKNOWN [Stylonychia lemnae]|uniref:Transmembrane protein n=1 Tax=Stylonychia lemnae TaxID=5949 RepID=A0A078B6U1_STYLE|nr:UNKNOWN [Stylonychia lemnae]|eukprot:CDW90104.1 UNKNOWN [Stylonychia lemnae]